MRIDSNSVANLFIFSSRGAPEPIRFAAEELSRYLRFLYGKSPRLVSEVPPSNAIILGTADELRRLAGENFHFEKSHPLFADGFHIRIRRDRAFIAGASARGVLFGVYHFIEKQLGVRFIGPGEEVVPEGKVVSHHRLEEHQEAAIALRGMHFGLPDETSGLPEEEILRGDIARIDWMAKVGMNHILFELFTPHLADLPRIEPYLERLIPEINRRGLILECGHHDLVFWVPPSRFAHSHPEYYALRGGKRRAPEEDPSGLGWNIFGQLSVCTSNEHLANEIARAMRLFLRRHPRVDILGLWPDDGIGSCECEKCRALDFLPPARTYRKENYAEFWPADDNKTRRLVIFFNRIVKELKIEFPRKRFSTIFYLDLLGPPEQAELPTDSVAYLSFYQRCYFHSLASQECPRNARFIRVLGDWKRAYQGMKVLYEYYTGYFGYASLPFPVWTGMQADIQTLRNFGISGLSVQGVTGNFWAYYLNCHAFARLAWQPDLDLTAYIEDILSASLGECSAAMADYYRTLLSGFLSYRSWPVISEDPKIAELQRRSPKCFLIGDESFLDFMTSDLLEALQSILSGAGRKAVKPEHRQRINREKVYLHYFRKAREALALKRTARLLSTEGADMTALEVARRAFRSLEYLIDYARAHEREGIISAPYAYKTWRRHQNWLKEHFGSDILT